jgi:hypothetical protein
MNRRELMRLMPRDGQDVAGAERIVALGYPVIAPVLPDIVRWLRVPESRVADTFADLLAVLGAPAAEAVAWRGLHPENCWARHRILCRVLPRWPEEALRCIAFMLTTTATQPDAYDNDLRAVEILAERRLAKPDWLAGWLEFKQERLDARVALLTRAKQAVDRAVDGST